MRLRKPLAWDKPLDDATRDECPGCGREIVRARLDGGRRVALDHPELGVESTLDGAGALVLLSHVGQARSRRGRRGSDARHTLHRCAP